MKVRFENEDGYEERNYHEVVLDGRHLRCGVTDAIIAYRNIHGRWTTNEGLTYSVVSMRAE